MDASYTSLTTLTVTDNVITLVAEVPKRVISFHIETESRPSSRHPPVSAEASKITRKPNLGDQLLDFFTLKLGESGGLYSFFFLSFWA